ncbi:hypothetical protein ACQCSX_07390 [Pseudarthrobacter sp. P1]|uniref:hypothetical protein n=1 Tax=Pseudarthrobacter sp. P1 TaxID=3418418 RepID=UPI003CEAE582
MTDDFHAPEPAQTTHGVDNVGGGTRAAATRKRRRILGSGAGAAVLAIALLGAAALSGCSAPAAPESTKSFPAFDKAEYAQIGAAATAVKPVDATTIKVEDKGVGESLPDWLMGLSIDTDFLNDNRLDPTGSDLAAMLKRLDKPVIRFGGQSVDRRFFWTSTDEPIPNWTLNPAYKGDKRPIVKVQPADLERLKRLLDASDGKVVLSADMGHFDPARNADLAANAEKILGDRLLGISLGNEPNGYNRTMSPYYTLRGPSWSFEDWAKEAAQVADAMVKAAPGVKIVGPEVYSNEWWKKFADAKLPNIGAMSYHHYPLNICPKDGDPLTPSIERAMSRSLADSSTAYSEAAVKVGKSANIPTWLTETGISTCAGANETTRKHVSGLSIVNYSLSAAQAGVSQIDLHSTLDACKGGAPLSPVCDAGTLKDPAGQFHMQPVYYGMMLVGNIGSGEFQKVDTAGDEDIYGYAVKHADGSMSVAIVNQNDPTTSAQAPITITLPQAAATGTMTQMTGPAFDAADQTRIDGLESGGVAKADRARIPGFTAGSSTITLPLTSGTATVLTFTF